MREATAATAQVESTRRLMAEDESEIAILGRRITEMNAAVASSKDALGGARARSRRRRDRRSKRSERRFSRSWMPRRRIAMAGRAPSRGRCSASTTGSEGRELRPFTRCRADPAGIAIPPFRSSGATSWRAAARSKCAKRVEFCCTRRGFEHSSTSALDTSRAARRRSGARSRDRALAAGDRLPAAPHSRIRDAPRTQSSFCVRGWNGCTIHSLSVDGQGGRPSRPRGARSGARLHPRRLRRRWNLLDDAADADDSRARRKGDAVHPAPDRGRLRPERCRRRCGDGGGRQSRRHVRLRHERGVAGCAALSRWAST